MIIGTIIEIVDLTKAMGKIDDAKREFDAQYQTLKSNVQQVVQASEGFRPQS